MAGDGSSALEVKNLVLPDNGITLMPNSTLIPDILSYIFLLCLPHDHLPDPKVNEAPLNVSHVCQSWRSLALSTLQLWAQLRIIIKPSPQYVPEQALPILSEWLRRSRTVDVKVAIEWERPPMEYDDNGRPLLPTYGVTTAHIYSLLSEISNYRKRIKGLALLLPDDHLVNSVDTVQTKLLSLDSLDLRFYRSWRARGTAVIDKQFSELFVGLREFSIDGEGTFQLPSEGHPACPALRKLRLLSLSVSADNVIKFLNVCPQLEEFTFSPPDTSGWGITPLPAFDPKLASTTFTSIRVLDITGNGQYTFIIGSLLDRLNLPQLQKLVLTFGEEWPFSNEQTWPHLEHFLRRSNPSLESLVLCNDWMTNAEVLRCLELLPSLRKLRARFSQEIADALRFLVPEDALRGKAILCPLLESVELNSITDQANAASVIQRITDVRGSLKIKMTVSP